MFGWGLSSQINNPQSYSKQRVTAGEKLDHLISISPPQGHATSPAEGWGGMGSSSKDLAGKQLSLAQRSPGGAPILLDVWGQSLVN